MTDYTLIFHNDFFMATMASIMSPRELYFYRQTTKYVYTIITLDTIKKKIIESVSNKLKLHLGDKYDGFINLMEKRNMTLYGPFVTSAIWGEQYDSSIRIRMADNNIKGMGTKDDNVFTDYKSIDPNTTIDPIQTFKTMIDWFQHESDRKIILNDYETNKKSKIKLHIFSCNDDGDISETYPTVFQNSIQVIDNQFHLKIKNINLVMHKTLPIFFDESDEFYSYTEMYKKLRKIHTKYNLEYKFPPLKNYIIDQEEHIIIICNKEHNNENHFTMFNHCFCSTKSDRISCNPIKVTNNEKINQLYVDVELKPFVTECQVLDCPFKMLQTIKPIKHFHSCVFLKKDNFKMVTKSIILKYDNDDNFFANYKPLFESANSITNEDIIIDNTLIDKCLLWEFPPRPVPKGFLGSDIISYRKMFNNNFDEGEFASDGPICDMAAFRSMVELYCNN